MSQHQTLSRKASTPWDRLRPVKQDPLDTFGFVSKGDTALLDPRKQESFYHQITARYMQFCSQHSKDLGQAFEALTIEPVQHKGKELLEKDGSWKADSLTQVKAAPWQQTTSRIKVKPDAPATGLEPRSARQKKTAEELSIILTALRKLREGILASSYKATSPVFSQRVHVFNIRLAILALHPESYHASLRLLLSSLHTKEHPLPTSELKEMISYLILDTALRLDDFNEAHRIRIYAREQHNIRDSTVEQILQAVTNDNWVIFWKKYSQVDGYTRALMHSAQPKVRSGSLKAIARAYMKSDVAWILKVSTGSKMTWDELVEAEAIGWLRDKNMVIIRKPKHKS